MDKSGSSTHYRSSLISTSSGGSSNLNSLRSAHGMEGLLLAETGGGMVALDLFNSTTGFKEGLPISQDNLVSGRPRLRPRYHSFDDQLILNNQGALSNPVIPSATASKELKAILGNAHSRLKSGASMSSSLAGETTALNERLLLEQTKSHALVEVDVALESNTSVQGGSLEGSLVVNILPHPKGYLVQITEPKLRVVGYEFVPSIDERHVFYQESQPISSLGSSWNAPFDSEPDDDGFARAKTGLHIIPFSLYLPVVGTCGDSKGVFDSSGVSVRYIVMATTKVKNTETGKMSVAHFYRECEIWPRLDPTTTLQSAPRPIQITASKSLFMGGSGTVKLTAILHRLHWVSGQRCFVKALVFNNTTRTLKSFTLTLIRRITTFKSSAAMNIDGRDDPDACQTNTTYKEVARSTLETSHRVLRGYAGSRGWWTGVNPGENIVFSHCVLIPPDALSVPRGRIVEVEYGIRATISAGPLSPNVFVDIPIRIVNFMSLDTPPSLADPNAVAGVVSLRTRYHASPETRNHSTDEQLDGESFRLSNRSSRTPGLSTSPSLAEVPGDHADSDAEVDIMVREASRRHPEPIAESVRKGTSQSSSQKVSTTVQTLACDPGRARSKTVSSIPQSSNSFVKLTQDKLLRMESDSSFATNGMASSTTPGSHHDIPNLTPSSSLTVSHHSLHHPSTSQPSSNFIPGELTTKQAPATPERVQSAPVQREEPPEQGTRPNAGRSRSDGAVRSSPTKAGPDKLNDVRKRIEELEAKMRGGKK